MSPASVISTRRVIWAWTRGIFLQGLPPHVDRREGDRKHKLSWFQEPIYGCVLCNTSPQSLFLEVSRGGERVYVPEEAGTCFLQQGASRFESRHGVEPLESGMRMSVTWRWFIEDGETARREYCGNDECAEYAVEGWSHCGRCSKT